MDWEGWVAIIALTISLALGLLNWVHSENLFRRTHYPAVPWYCPEASAGEKGTRVTSKIVNIGPRDIFSLSFTCFLASGLKKEPWCQAVAERVPLNEEYVFIMTDTLEDDIRERFGGLYDEQGWRFRDKPRNFKVIMQLSYIPALAEADWVTRKMSCRLVPICKEAIVSEWHFHPEPQWRRFLPF